MLESIGSGHSVSAVGMIGTRGRDGLERDTHEIGSCVDTKLVAFLRNVQRCPVDGRIVHQRFLDIRNDHHKTRPPDIKTKRASLRLESESVLLQLDLQPLPDTLDGIRADKNVRFVQILDYETFLLVLG